MISITVEPGGMKIILVEPAPCGAMSTRLAPHVAAACATLASGGDAAGAAETANPAVGSKFDSIAAAVDIRPKQTARKSRGLSAATLAMAGKRKGGKRDADATK